MTAKLNWDIIIPACDEKHNNYYWYIKEEQPEYKNIDDTKMVVHCPKHDIFEISVGKHKNEGQGCRTCGIIRRTSKLRLDWETVIGDCIDVHDGFYTYYDDEQPTYIDNRTKMVVHCPEHGMFNISVADHKRGQGCNKCRYNTLGDIFRSNWEDVIGICKIIHDDTYIYHIEDQIKYVNNNTRMIVYCNEHGDFEVSVANHKRGHGCGSCNISKGERTIEKYLDDNNIYHIAQYTYDDCRGDFYPLSFDFYLPDYNILIEYDGEQHYTYIPYFHKKGYYQFERQQRYDEIKNQYSRNNNISLIRIRYDVDDITEILNKELVPFTY